MRAYSLLLKYARGKVLKKELPAAVQALAAIHCVVPGRDLPINFPQFRNKYSVKS